MATRMKDAPAGLDPAIFADPLITLNRDVKEASALLTPQEARYTVDMYYALQDFRMQARNQERALDASGEPNALTGWLADNMQRMEGWMKLALGRFADAQVPGQWAQSITGIGPVLAAGLLAHIDITRSHTVGHIWRFAGLDPTVTWDRGQKRPWNGDLRVLCWKIGESFVKVSNNDNDVYGHIYAERKLLEQTRNEAGQFAEQAKRTLARAKFRENATRAAYEAGKLPPAHIHARAKRYAVKLFLSHLHHVMYETHYGTPPPMPYIFTRPEHTHYLAPPNWPLVE